MGQDKGKRISLKEAYGISETGEPIRPAAMEEVRAWLNENLEENPDVVNEILDILTDYEAERDMQACSEAGVIRKDARTLLCNHCGRRVMLMDPYCAGCGRRLSWNLREEKR